MLPPSFRSRIGRSLYDPSRPETQGRGSNDPRWSSNSGIWNDGRVSMDRSLAPYHFFRTAGGYMTSIPRTMEYRGQIGESLRKQANPERNVGTGTAFGVNGNGLRRNRFNKGLVF